MKKENYLDKIDNYLFLRKQNEVTMIFVGAFAVIALLVYLTLFTPSEDYNSAAQSRFNDITAKLSATDAYLASVSRNGDENYEISRQQKILTQAKNRLENIKKVNTYFDDKLRELSYLLFNQQDWAAFLNSLTQKAKKYNIKINKIENNVKNLTYQKPQEILKITIDLEGSFSDILRYINSIEESKLVIDMNYINLVTNGSRLSGVIYISVWGMKY